jgi:hypothetical protein
MFYMQVQLEHFSRVFSRPEMRLMLKSDEVWNEPDVSYPFLFDVSYFEV